MKSVIRNYCIYITNAFLIPFDNEQERDLSHVQFPPRVFAGLVLTEDAGGEVLQVNHYGSAGHYIPHHDFVGAHYKAVSDQRLSILCCCPCIYIYTAGP